MVAKAMHTLVNMDKVRRPKLVIKSGLSDGDVTKAPLLILGQKHHLLNLDYDTLACKLLPKIPQEEWETALKSVSPGPMDTCPLYLNLAAVAVLPNKCSRHNTPSRSHSITRIVKANTVDGKEFIVMVCERANVFASVCAIARGYPSFCRKTNSSSRSKDYTITIEILLGDNDSASLTDEEIQALTDACEGVRLASHIVDMPADEMNTDAFIQEIKNVGYELGIIPTIIRGNELAEKGFGGLYGVGKAAIHPPALVVLSHKPPGAVENIAWVGKGIVYDTGGLSLKSKLAMVGMKRDCGGAAAVLGAFYATVKSGFTQNLHAIFCLAENAIGPGATRPDDIHTLYSGRTVEINNTDAEGRLVLGDGVAYAVRDLKCKTILDIATLTGAQGIATGKYHAALVTNEARWEELAVKSGRASGDLIHPLPFTPELHFSEFNSSVADMKNSVNDRSNASSSCAGLFIFAHMGFNFKGSWIHVDMASPVISGERATGYGVGLLTAMFSSSSSNPLIKALSTYDIVGNETDDDNGNGATTKRLKIS